MWAGQRRAEAANRARASHAQLIAEAQAAARAFAASVEPKTEGRWWCMWGAHTWQFYAFYQGPGSERGICVAASTLDELWKRINEKDAELRLVLLPAWLR